MRARAIGLVPSVSLTLFAACAAESSPAGDATEPTGWQPLVTKTWTLAPGQEKTSDLQIVDLDRDLVIGAIRPISPRGTHHTLLYQGTAGTNMIYASGVGTNELTFPPGTGLRLAAGTILGLQLHIYNTTDEELTGLSGIEVLTVDPETVTDEVDLFLPGPRDLAIVPGQSTTIAGTCTLTAPQRVFAVFPHMHQLGTHFKSTLSVGGTPRVLSDAAYSFDHQAVLSFDPIALAPGDTITTECTWNNPGSEIVTYGESSSTEMCYSIMYRYPRQDAEFCTQ